MTTLTREDVALLDDHPKTGELLVPRAQLEAFIAERDRLATELAEVNANVDASTEAGAAYAVAEARKAWEAERDRLAAERDCLLAARVSWPAEVLDAVRRGDVEACRADAKRRHDNWERLHAQVAQLREAFKRLADAVIEGEELHATDGNGDDLPERSDGADCDCPLPNLINSTLATADSARWLAEHDDAVRAESAARVERLTAALREMVEKGEGCAACGDGLTGDCGCRYERARAALAPPSGDGGWGVKKHTPAPWVATESDGDVVLVEALTKDRKHVTREICHVLDADEHTAANLRLIALAPEMLDVLEGLVVNTDAHDFADESWWESARNLIARARGGGA